MSVDWQPPVELKAKTAKVRNPRGNVAPGLLVATVVATVILKVVA